MGFHDYDYYPFGMSMPARNYSSAIYRYGFNGKENDNEVKGDGGQQDYGMRIYDPRLAKFLSVDPLTQKYPWLTPYQFAGNTPIQAIDVDGEEGGVPTKENKVVNLFISPTNLLTSDGNYKNLAMLPGYYFASKYTNVPSSNLIAFQAGTATDVYNYINELKTNGYVIGNIIIDSHGDHGTSFSVGNEKFSTGTEPALTKITSQVTGSVIIMGCQMGKNNENVLTNIAASMENSTDKTVIASEGWVSDWPGFLNTKDNKDDIKRAITKLWDNNSDFRNEVKEATPGVVRGLIGRKGYIRILTKRVMKEGISPSGAFESINGTKSYSPDDPTNGPIYAKVGKWNKVSPSGTKPIKGNFYLDSNGNYHNFKRRSFYQTVFGKIYKALTEKSHGGKKVNTGN
ncbi:MAG: RHS repeat-associated core domain-containing protein [Ferruginibacter sp.]